MNRKNTIWFYAFAIGGVIVDQITKLLARANLTEDRAISVIPGVLDLRLVYNRGAAFGVLPDWAPLFVLIGLVAIFAIVRLRRVGSASLGLSTGLGLLLGGALGNLIDRILFPGRGVTDFIELSVKLGRHQWPTFNVADIAIVAGAILVLFHVYVMEKLRNHEQPIDERDQEGDTGQ